MREESNVMRLLLKYGTTLVIALTFVGVGVMLSQISIRNKVPMQIVLEQDGKIYGYVNQSKLMQGSTMICAYTEDNVKLAFTSAGTSRSQMVLLHPKDSTRVYRYLSARPVITAYLYDGETRLIELVFRKWSKR